MIINDITDIAADLLQHILTGDNAPPHTMMVHARERSAPAPVSLAGLFAEEANQIAKERDILKKMIEDVAGVALTLIHFLMIKKWGIILESYAIFLYRSYLQWQVPLIV